jgi:hypothetical protein
MYINISWLQINYFYPSNAHHFLIIIFMANIKINYTELRHFLLSFLVFKLYSVEKMWHNFQQKSTCFCLKWKCVQQWWLFCFIATCLLHPQQFAEYRFMCIVVTDLCELKVYFQIPVLTLLCCTHVFIFSSWYISCLNLSIVMKKDTRLL